MPSTPAIALAIVLPAWNAAATLGAALASLQAQTEPDFELVLVDYGSTDGSAALVAAAAWRDCCARVCGKRVIVPLPACALEAKECRG